MVAAAVLPTPLERPAASGLLRPVPLTSPPAGSGPASSALAPLHRAARAVGRRMPPPLLRAASCASISFKTGRFHLPAPVPRLRRHARPPSRLTSYCCAAVFLLQAGRGSIHHQRSPLPWTSPARPICVIRPGLLHSCRTTTHRCHHAPPIVVSFDAKSNDH